MIKQGFGPIIEALEAQFSEHWTYTTVAYENKPFDLPGIGECWIKVAIEGVESKTKEIEPMRGQRRLQTVHQGTIAVDCYTPSGDGSGNSFAMAERAASIVRKLDGSVGLGNKNHYFADPDTEGKFAPYFKIRVAITFYQVTNQNIE